MEVKNIFIANKKNIIIAVLALLVLFKVFFNIKESKQDKIQSYDYHASVLKNLKVGDVILTANDIYDLTKGKYHNELSVTEKAIQCLSDFLVDESSGSPQYFFAMKLIVKKRSVFYRVYGTDNDVFYISPMNTIDGDVKNEMQRLRINCHFSDVVTY